MKRFVVLASVLLLVAPPILALEKVVVLVDGSVLEVVSYEVEGNLVVLKTTEGKLRSVPRSYVNLVATEERNRGGEQSPAAARPSPPLPPPRPQPSAPTPPPLPVEPVEEEEPIPTPVPEPPRAMPRVTAPEEDVAPHPPPVWSNEDLHVSLVVPSASWRLEDRPPSFDVAVAIESPETEARATLALIRQKIRNRNDFRDVVEDVERSIARSPGYRSLSNGSLALDPYTGHEFRFVKTAGFVTVYNRLVVLYSRDLAYVLSLSCPEERLAENEAAFEALVRGLVIKKPRNELTF